MEKLPALKKLFSKRAKDYSYAIVFFLIFSFFILAVIRPNILSVFVAQQKIQKLEKLNEAFDKQINNVISIQSTIEQYRDNFFLLKEAVSRAPQVNKILSDLNNAIGNNHLTVDKINIGEVNLKDVGTGQKLKSVAIHSDLSGKFEDINNLISDLYGQRRLKVIKKMTVGKDEKEASDSSQLKIQLDVEGYYL
jgi:Tfp pilus assembly protein PilO